MVKSVKRNSVNKLAKQKQKVIKELKKSGKAYRKARKEFGKNDPLRKKKSSVKKTKKAQKLRCFSRLTSKKKRYVTCIKPKTKKGSGRFPLNYFGAPMHKNYNKKSMCLKL
jgi:hypothetical protein